jgi:hypothetical protein
VTGVRLLAAILLLGLGATHGAADVLTGVGRVGLDVAIEHPIEGLRVDDLGRRLATFLSDQRPSITHDETSEARLRLAVAVRPHSATTLRGFWLPFSGQYAIGPVRLALERAVRLPGHSSREVTAVVWQRERIVTTRWSAAGAAVVRAVEELLAELHAAA